MTLLENTPLVLSLLAILFAQLLKVPMHLIIMRKWDWSLLTSTGGMPSSHSAAVTSLATAVGFEIGFDSPIFAVAAMFAAIVMYDASGIRYQAGQHAAALNEIRRELQIFFRDIKRWPDMNEEEKIEELKTLLGHKRSEVLAGAIAGIVFSCAVYSIMAY